MRLLDVSFEEPAKNLALDEVLLDRAEQGLGGDALRLWESSVPFVVVGTAQKLEREVMARACREDSVPTMRRCTAGGCVLQGPGCLNFSLVLTLAAHPEVRGLHPSYAYLLGRLAEVLGERGLDVRQQGICDLALNGKKVSGNAQRRRRNAILHHGTLLYRPDYEAMERYLAEPEQRPAYRGPRRHRDFVGALPLGPGELRQVACAAFFATESSETMTPEERQAVTVLAQEKYRSRAWTLRR